MTTKPIAESCNRNRAPILEIIQPLLVNASNLLEIGSGTGQHAVYFATEMPHLHWQTSDIKENHQDIMLWLEEYQLKNTPLPIALNVLTDLWPNQYYDAIFSSNTAHIMPWQAVEAMFKGIGKRLNTGGVFILYGPFNYQGEFTSNSNRQFEEWLKSQGLERGIRDFEAMQELAEKDNLTLLHDYPMPANNRILVWTKNDF